MNTATTLSPVDRAAIESLLTEYGWRLDHGGDAGALFVPEGRILAPGLGMEVTGREAISKHLATMHADPLQVTRHIWMDLHIAEVGGATVRLNTVQMTCLRLPGEPPAAKHLMIGDTHDLVRRGPDGQWLFVERRLDMIFPFDVKPGKPAAASG